MVFATVHNTKYTKLAQLPITKLIIGEKKIDKMVKGKKEICSLFFGKEADGN